MEMQDNRGDLGQVRLSIELRARSRELCNRAAREIARSKEAKTLFEELQSEILGRQAVQSETRAKIESTRSQSNLLRSACSNA
jgi:hypothetical protein